MARAVGEVPALGPKQSSDHLPGDFPQSTSSARLAEIAERCRSEFEHVAKKTCPEPCHPAAAVRTVSFTQARVRRAIAAARSAGLQVVGIQPDGTVLVTDSNRPQRENSIDPDSEVVL
jgi:hypothetical protein